VRTNAPHSPSDSRDKPGHDVEGKGAEAAPLL
jgi:hypothetical protein